MNLSAGRIATTIILITLPLLGGLAGWGAYQYLKANNTISSLESAFSMADQLYKEGRDLETEGELTLSRLKYAQARELYQREGDQKKINLVNEGIARTLWLAQDYSLTVDALLGLLSSRIQGFQPYELSSWELKGFIKYRYIDGQKRYFNQIINNLAYSDAAIARRIPGWNEALLSWLRVLYPYPLADDWGVTAVDYRNPLNFTVSNRMTLEGSQLPAYQTVKCWLPYPVYSPAQPYIKLLAVQPPTAKTPPLTESNVGILYAEFKNQPPQATVLEFQYQVQTREVLKNIDPAWVGEYDVNSSLFQEYTRSEPHLEISDPIKDTARQIVGQETNPALKAQLIYKWIINNIRLQEVSYPLVLASSASHMALEQQAGDSTLMAFLFTTLCRSQGIPARVVGGYRLIPGAEAPHTWAEFYLPHYGWVPVDPGTAKFLCLSPELTAAQKNRVIDYYFGHLDPYRLLINQNAPAALIPPRLSERTLSLILQQPEVEAGGANIPRGAMSFKLSAVKTSP